MRAVKLMVAVLVVMGLVYATIWAWRTTVERARGYAEELITMNSEQTGMETSRATGVFDLAGAKGLTIGNDFGSVEVSAGGPKVEVQQFIYAGQDDRARELAKEFSVVSAPDGRGGLKISVKGGEQGRGASRVWIGFGRAPARPRVRVKLVVTVPPEVGLQVEVKSGEVKVVGMKAAVTAASGSGEISLRNIRGAVIASTGSGSIDGKRLLGGVTAETGSGSIDLAVVRGHASAKTGSGGLALSDVDGDEILADTGSGDIQMSEVSAGSIRAEAASGSIEVRVNRPFTGQMRLDTGSGGVTLALPAGSDCRVDAHTSSGGIDSGLLLQSVSSSRGKLTGVMGAGRGSVEVSTGSGGIALEAAG
jgi:hypothetical protein